jgi:hypothetical protein
MDWHAFFSAIGGTATALLVLGFLGRTLVEQWFKKDLKRFENKLDEIAAAQQIKFTKLHDSRSGIVADLFLKVIGLERLLDHYHRVKIFINLAESDLQRQTEKKQAEEAFQTVRERRHALESFVEINRIYFSQGFVEQLKDLFPLVDRAIIKIGQISDSIPLEQAAWGDSEVLLMQSELRRNIAKIELQFKELLGVENGDKGT